MIFAVTIVRNRRDWSPRGLSQRDDSAQTLAPAFSVAQEQAILGKHGNLFVHAHPAFYRYKIIEAFSDPPFVLQPPIDRTIASRVA
jgi:hypothetical protein